MPAVVATEVPVKNPLLVGALAITVALASPALAQTPAPALRASPAEPAPGPAAATPPAEGRHMKGAMEMRDRGGGDMGGGRMMRMMMMHRMMIRADPK